MCRHEHGSGRTTYDRENARLFYLLICDECHAEITRTPGPEYKPNFVLAPQPKSA